MSCFSEQTNKNDDDDDDDEGKTNFSRRLKQFDGLTWLTPTFLFYDRSTPLLIND